MARWGPIFQVLTLERPWVQLEWEPVGFPLVDRSILDGGDVGLFLQPPPEPGLTGITMESSPMVVAVAVGHPLAQRPELSVADILDEPFPGGSRHHPEWRAFWTLDEYRGRPPRFLGDVANVEEALDLVVSGRAIATMTAPVADGLPHPGVIAVPLRDGPQVATRLVWRADEDGPAVRALAEIALEMSRGGGGS